MKDSNTCPHCRQRNRIEDARCGSCSQTIVLPADGAISLWRLGPIRDGLVGILAQAITDALSIPCVIQPAFASCMDSSRAKKLSSEFYFLRPLERCEIKILRLLSFIGKCFWVTAH